MSCDEGPQPPHLDWTAQRGFLGRPVSVWQLNLAALLAVLFVAFVGFSFSGPFLPLLLRTVFGFAALNALSALATDVWQLAVLRLLMGALGGFTAVALTLASLSAPPEQTTRAIALVQSAQILGQMVGPALGGLMADHWGIRAAFFGSSALAVVAGVNMLLMYHEPQVYTQQRRTRRS